MRKITSMVMVLTLIFSLVLFNGNIAQNSVLADDKGGYTGEEYFLGIVFGQGEVGKKLSSLYKQEDLEFTQSEEFQIFINDFLDYIKVEDPAYFDDLKESVENNNPQALTENLEKTQHHFADFAELNITQAENSEGEIEPYACGPTACVAVLALAVHNVAVLSQVSAAASVSVLALAVKTAAGVNSADSISNNEHAAALILKDLN
ncbi:sporulation delaying protein family toxin [Mammaliicoccus sciuri]|uniref:Sporulation delaying protein family toxin n=3 Tax=Mammaliicoccus TaxID=2803850 RepID=A0AAX3W2X9_MAMLE|nr:MULTISPECIES: sporulation delaying protein family toxin [Mammaliicoccus]MCE5040786.1 sporulation delaying protein family toxin [Mammaliicoccus sciuri]WHI59703.1 sporulation delaying protein family toxin [Mammaliicoccus lentus]